MVKHQEDSRLLAAAIFLLFSLSIISGLFFREPWLWMDEVLSYVLISDPSPTHLNQAVVSNMDANPPLFPNLYWLVGHMISLKPIFFRSFSVLLFTSTLALFFWYTTRLIGNAVTNFVLISAMVYLTYQNFEHATQIRSYALLLPISYVYFIVLQQLINRPTDTWLLALHTVIGLLMAFCHNYGLFYLAASGAFFGVLLIWSKEKSYLPIFATYALIGLVWLVVWYPSFTIQSDAGKPHSWIPLPTVKSFFTGVGDLIPSVSDKLEWQSSFWWLAILRVSLVIGLFVYLAVPKLKLGFDAMRRDKAFQFFLLSGSIYLGILVIALIISFTYTSVFLRRYMWPSQLLIMFELVYAYYQFVGERRVMPQFARLLPIYAFVLGGAIFYKVWKMQTSFQSRILTYLPQLSAQYPVFVERADYFLPIWFHNQHPNVSFLLDWRNADRPGNIKSATVDYKILKSLKDNYNVSGIIPVDRFNATNYPHFYVVDEQAVYQIEDYIKSGQVKVISQRPVSIAGVRLLECSFVSQDSLPAGSAKHLISFNK
ncbi:hypothetical protein M0L20_18300 [Spirosoma sp. RP8]|uniref:Glycosyltransferase RgtA/B/C/D-like domain-containing protein n=1 Tax=Spirosoma liriopis TaxID=2937440 RepID=A0ABT0HNS8_9BACT|nr:hypothetical protein [Spirosoma liriopis]MCK8493824.1 hypothetical protein [Spirosoma liriopis]